MSASSGILKTKYKENPFVEGNSFTVPMRNRAETLDTAGPLQVTATETGETLEVAQIRRVKVIDNESFVKLYVAHLDAFFDLKPGTVRLLMALLDELSSAKNAHGDTIYLNYARVSDYFKSRNAKPPAKATFFSAMAELTENGVVAPSVDTNLWFINPAIFFNGDRIRFVTELRRKRSNRMQALEEAGQQRLGLPEETIDMSPSKIASKEDIDALLPVVDDQTPTRTGDDT